MGTTSSKKNLGQIVAIYGYTYNIFQWKQIDSRVVFHTTGLIVGDHQSNLKYLITTRDRLINCKDIVMYHCDFREPHNIIMRNNLCILFQSIEFNFIILGTVGFQSLDFNSSEIISGDYDSKITFPYHNVSPNDHIVPTKRSHYYVIRMEMNLETETLNYIVHIHDTIFEKSISYDETFLPANYMYKFTLKDKIQSGIHGAIIINKKNKLIGLVSHTQITTNTLFISPTKIISKMFSDYTTCINKPSEYNGSMCLPFNYDANMIITNSNNHLKQNDKLISINDHTITNKDNEAVVFDPDYKTHIPLENFLMLTLKPNIPVDIEIMRNKKIMKFPIYGSYINEISSIPLTSQSYFNPHHIIPFININGIIIVQLTHELIDITVRDKIILTNSIIDDLKENNLEPSEKIFIVIDCLNDVLRVKYALPTIIIPEEKSIVINCPFIISINQKSIKFLSEIESVVASTNAPVEILVGVAHNKNKQLVITI